MAWWLLSMSQSGEGYPPTSIVGSQQISMSWSYGGYYGPVWLYSAPGKEDTEQVHITPHRGLASASISAQTANEIR